MENIWKQPKCPSMDEWIKKIWYVYTMDCYSDMEKEGTQTVWIDLEGIMLSEIRQADIILSQKINKKRSS